jgi:hypothetical protein
MSGQVSDLVLRMTGPAGGSGSLRTPLRASPEPSMKDPDKSAQIPSRLLHIPANSAIPNAKRARLGAKPGFSSVDAK